MRIGLTYDLRDDYLAEGWPLDQAAEFDRADTVDAVESALRATGAQTDRIGHARALMGRLLRGDRWDLVFNFAEGTRGYGRESLVPALLDAFGIPYTFSDPLVCAVTLHKATAKRLLRDQGVPTPDFALVEGAEDGARVDLPFPLFAKPVAEGSSKGVTTRSRANNRAELLAVCRDLIDRYNQPTLVEAYLPGREFTVGVLGTGARARAVAALEVVLRKGADPGDYTFANKEDCETLVDYRVEHGPLGREACDLALRAWRVLGCRDAGRVDVRADASGRLQVIELNPLPGLHPQHSDLPILCGLVGMSHQALIASILTSAMERMEAPEFTPCAS